VTSTFHAAFDLKKFTFFPLEETLKTCIIFEENQLLNRQAIVDSGEEDPGRPPYEDFYESIDSQAVHCGVHFKALGVPSSFCRENPGGGTFKTHPSLDVEDEFLTFTSTPLWCSTNILVGLRTSMLMDIRPRSAEQVSRIDLTSHPCIGSQIS
jgi:hypothetical protein